jgi:hypothetical protein
MPTERNYLINGRFLQNLNGWTAENGASYLASDGDDHYGIANLPVGGSVRQDFAVDNARAYTLHVAAKAPLRDTHGWASHICDYGRGR